jgi:hypothetical protein
MREYPKLPNILNPLSFSVSLPSTARFSSRGWKEGQLRERGFLR